MINAFSSNITLLNKLPTPLKRAIQDLEVITGKQLFQWTKSFDYYKLTIDDTDIKIGCVLAESLSQEELFNILFDRFKVNKDTWDENLYNSEIAQAFHDAAADWAYIV